MECGIALFSAETTQEEAGRQDQHGRLSHTLHEVAMVQSSVGTPCICPKQRVPFGLLRSSPCEPTHLEMKKPRSFFLGNIRNRFINCGFSVLNDVSIFQWAREALI